jgi:hypothetical protein
MSTTYYVVPAGRAFNTSFPDFPGINMAREASAQLTAEDGIERGIFAVEMVAGIRKTAWGDTVHAIDDREIVTSRDVAGEWFAYDDNYGVEDTMRYGHGRSELEAIEECLDTLLDYEAEVFAAKIAAECFVPEEESAS